MPHSTDRDYAERSIPQYERAIEQAGGQPVRIPLDQPSEETKKIIEHCDAVLLPGSGADVDPSRFHALLSPHTAPADLRREAVDAILLQHAYAQRKPILGICYGLQSLNVYRNGSLIQHIQDFLPQQLRELVNHDAGKKVAVAHEVEIESNSKLAKIVSGKAREAQQTDVVEGNDREGHGYSRADGESGENRVLAPDGNSLTLPVNSSHHQSADRIGDGLRISARCTSDNIIEALEGTDRHHFVLAVQWHPERSIKNDEPSRAIFRALIEAAAANQQ